MRITFTGGGWSNAEDEMLKAGVQKYGKNAWDRVASLIARKTSAQCKARWNEWINPNINKNEWTRDEEQKLLQLVEAHGSLWRTIATQIAGRTAAQCQEHYELLLDRAHGTEGAGDAKNRIIVAPEAQAATADAVDLDDYEKDMLDEGRGRLANTMGKKAMRKIREAKLQEAKQRATLQQKRELREAGAAAQSDDDEDNELADADLAAVDDDAADGSGLFATKEEEQRERKMRAEARRKERESFRPIDQDEIDGTAKASPKSQAKKNLQEVGEKRDRPEPTSFAFALGEEDVEGDQAPSLKKKAPTSTTELTLDLSSHLSKLASTPSHQQQRTVAPSPLSLSSARSPPTGTAHSKAVVGTSSASSPDGLIEQELRLMETEARRAQLISLGGGTGGSTTTMSFQPSSTSFHRLASGTSRRNKEEADQQEELLDAARRLVDDEVATMQATGVELEVETQCEKHYWNDFDGSDEAEHAARMQTLQKLKLEADRAVEAARQRVKSKLEAVGNDLRADFRNRADAAEMAQELHWKRIELRVRRAEAKRLGVELLDFDEEDA